MKFGLCGGIQKAAQLPEGTLDYVESGLAGSVYGMSDEDIKNALALSKSCGVPMEAANGFFPKEIRLVGADYSPEKVKEYTKVALYKAAQLGIHTVVLGSGGSRKMDEGDDPISCLAQFEEVLGIVGDIAQPLNTIIAIEPLNKGETNLCNSVVEGYAYAKRVNHPNVRVLADLYHVGLENEFMPDIANCGDWLKHVHIACVQGRTAPLPDDGFDYIPFRNALKAAGYDLRISIEGRIQGEFKETVPASIAYLRKIFG